MLVLLLPTAVWELEMISGLIRVSICSIILWSVSSPSLSVQSIQEIHLGDPTVLGADSYLNYPADLAQGNDDTLYVLDGFGSSSGKCVVAFSLQGEELFRFGGDGEGPGEFQGPRAIAFTGYSVLVLDYQLSRIEEFTTGGQYLRTIRLNIRVGFDMIVHDGSVYLHQRSENVIISRFSLDSPADISPVLTTDHPQLQGMTTRSIGRIQFSAGDDELLVTFPSKAMFTGIDWDTDHNQCVFIQPQCDVIERESRRIEQLQREAARQGVQIGDIYLYGIVSWSTNQVLIEVTEWTGEMRKVHGIVFDTSTGVEVGKRINPQLGHGGMYRLRNGDLAWIDRSSNTVYIYPIVGY